MPTVVEHDSDGFYVVSTTADNRIVRRIVGCPSRNDVHDRIRAELTALGATVGRSVAVELLHWTWTLSGWHRDDALP